MIFTVEEARDILRIDGNDNDTLIAALVEAIPHTSKRRPATRRQGISPPSPRLPGGSSFGNGTMGKIPIRTNCSG